MPDNVYYVAEIKMSNGRTTHVRSKTTAGLEKLIQDLKRYDPGAKVVKIRQVEARNA